MNKLTKQKLQLILNLVLTILSLLALVVSMVAWFSNRKYADVDNLSLHIRRQAINVVEQPQSILLPCATKIDDVTKDDFNNHCIVIAKYTIEGEGEFFVEVENKNGLLGYVWDESVDGVINLNSNGVIQNPPDFYGVISKKLSDKSLPNYQYNTVAQALDDINSRRVGKTNINDDTDIFIVYWGDYNYLGNTLNKQSSGVYSYQEIVFPANVMFVA